MNSQLKPGKQYIYEYENGRTYAREFGSSERILIGENYDVDANKRKTKIAEEWIPVVMAAEQNPALQDALDRAKLIYELTKQENNLPVAHHPV